MNDVLGIMGSLQSGGGILVGFALVIWELRSIRHDFNRHEHDEEGRPFLKVDK